MYPLAASIDNSCGARGESFGLSVTVCTAGAAGGATWDSAKNGNMGVHSHEITPKIDGLSVHHGKSLENAFGGFPMILESLSNRNGYNQQKCGELSNRE